MRKSDQIKGGMPQADPDSMTDLHDGIMMWLDRKLRAATEIPNFVKQLRTFEAESLIERPSDYRSTAYLDQLPGDSAKMAADWRLENSEIIWEFPLKYRRNSNPSGFLDLMYECNVTSAVSRYKINLKTVEVKTALFGRDYVSNKEVFDSFEVVTNRLVDQILCAIEVKTRISNVGDVIRQINYYRSFFSSNRVQFYVCCQDAKFKDLLGSQGIGFIKAPMNLDE